ncbi:putative ATP-grasp target RiPP [Streptosporangium sp. NPDC002524]
MSKFAIDDLPFEGTELAEAELGQVSGGMPGWVLTYGPQGCVRESA